jgi:hypothetical protein
MKRIWILLFIVGLLGCNEPQIVLSEPIGLGANPQLNAIISYKFVEKVAYVKVNTTIGAKYSLQLHDISAKEPLKTKGFTATEEESTLVIDLASVPRGLYDLTLTDISGNTSKLPINIL